MTEFFGHIYVCAYNITYMHIYILHAYIYCPSIIRMDNIWESLFFVWLKLNENILFSATVCSVSQLQTEWWQY